MRSISPYFFLFHHAVSVRGYSNDMEKDVGFDIGVVPGQAVAVGWDKKTLRKAVHETSIPKFTSSMTKLSHYLQILLS
jgi:hypothetical protein